MGTANQCRAMGLKVGDTIEGKEGNGKWWNITRLTLLWLGTDIAVWSEQHISSENDEWTPPKEEACWTLEYRDWRKVTPNVELRGERNERSE